MKRMKMKKNEKLQLADGWKKFLRHCKIKDLSEYTIEYYQESFDYFIKFLMKKNEVKDNNFDINGINSELIEDFILWLVETYNMNNTSINTRLRGIRTFIYYLIDKDYIEPFKISLLKTNRRIKETYTDQELNKLLKKPNIKECNFATYRNWVMINFFLATGVRSRTLRNVKVGDIDLEDATVDLLIVKNKNQQVIPLARTMIKILEEYLNYRGGEKNDYLFCSTYKGKLKSSSINSAIRSYNLKRGVDKTSPHLFRHTFAKKWILAGGDIFRLQKILGHSTMDVVREYVNMYGKDLKKNFNKFNALEQVSSQKEFIKLQK